MPERPTDGLDKPPAKPTSPPSDPAYTEDEEAEVRKRLEDLGYVE
jgi:hypothetical protein